MENRKSKSQTSLLTRVASTTDLLPHTQSLHSKFSLYNAGAGIAPAGQLPAIPSRPGSSRPRSRVGLRPMSSRPMSSRPPQTQVELSSRPATRLEPSRSPSRSMGRQQSAGPRQRPGSAIRPLSAGVFMRRMEHGWVAKHYPRTDQPTISQTNLSDDLEDGSDCESLDSFFNEEFDEREETERLGDLLLCNTLGVESRGHKRDWIAGEVGIPKFHCPRCRDHWYGLTPFPCDEELARLIREGLWYTGKGDTGKKQMKTNSGKWTGKRGGTEGTEGGSPGRGDGGSSGQKPKRILKGGNGENGSSGLEKSKEKNKRKITFKLDNGTGSGVELNQKPGSSELPKDNGQAKTTAGDEDELRLNCLSDSKSGKGMTNSTADNLLDGVGSSNISSSTRNGFGSENAGLLESSGSNGSLAKGQIRSFGGEKIDGSSSNQSSNLLNSMSEEDGKSSGGKASRTHTSDEHTSTKKGSSSFSSDEAGMGQAADTGNLRMSQSGQPGPSEGPSGATDGQSESGDNKGNGGGASLQQESLSSVASSTHGRKTSDSVGPDYGRKVRKPGGYMRASSPTGSEWGDPSHARPYASSTVASSRTASTSNLHRAPSSLPPIIPPIRTARKPTVDFLEGGFEITPPWRYSYFSPSPLHTASAPRTTTTASRKKK